MKNILTKTILLVLLVLFGCTSDMDDSYFNVASTFPANGAENVYIGSMIGASFSEPVDPAMITSSSFTVSRQSEDTQVTGEITVSSDYKNVTFSVQDTYLKPDTTYVVNLSGSITSDSGSFFAPFSFSFTTTQVTQIESSELYDMIFTDSIMPVIIDLREAYEIANGSIAGSTFVSFDDIIDENYLPSDLNTEVVFVSLDGAQGIAAASKLVSLGYTDVRNLNGGISAWVAAEYPLQGSISDDFSVISVTPASVLVNVLVNHEISAAFSNTVNPATVSSNTFMVKRSLDNSIVPGSFSVDDRTITFVPEDTQEYPYNLLYPDEQYIIQLDGITDFYNNALPLTLYAFSTTSYKRMSLAGVNGITNVPDDNYYLVDLRDMSGITDGLIKYCNYITYDTIMSGDFEFLPEDTSSTIVFISQTGYESDIAASYVAQNGYISVMCMESGIDGWTEAGFSLTNIYFTQVAGYNNDGPLWLYFTWETIATQADTFEYKLEKGMEVIEDWTTTSSKSQDIWIEHDGYYIFSVRIANTPSSTIMRAFNVSGCG